MRRILVALALWLAVALPGFAQDIASLIADRLEISGDTQLIAEGNVEVFFESRRLTATRIVFDQATDRLEIIGPIVLTDDAGDSVILASQADMEADLTEGILTSARLVLNRQLQLSANQIMRVGGRYTALQSVTASSCKVCEGNQTPLWEIRARRVVHDEQERQIYFDNATFRVIGVPVFYIPRLRIPDPSLDRATGFLKPTLRTTSDLGAGLKFPYFIVLSPSSDLTVTPYITVRNSQTLDLRYRQIFTTGQIELNGAVTRDELMPGKTRGYLFLDGGFQLPRDFGLVLKGQTVSDPAYFLDYGLGYIDRLDSRIEVNRTRRNENISARIISFQTMREDEDNSTIPSIVADLTYHRRLSLGTLGDGALRLQTHNHYRSSTDPFDGPDSDDIADGRDLGRISARVDWRKSFLLPVGIEATILGDLTADAYTISEDATYQGNTMRTHGNAGVELRWPLVKAEAGGAVQVIEPVAQAIWASSDDEELPNEDSVLVEFDEGNLFSLDRFPGSDAVERGPRVNLGVTWTRHAPGGWSMGATVGRVFREADLGQFGPSSGLDGSTSDWLAAVDFDLANGLDLTARAVVDDDLDLTKGEARMVYSGKRTSLAGSLIWSVADPLENRPIPTQEAAFDARRKLSPNWTAKASGRYDFVAEQGSVAGLGVEFVNECVRFDVSLSRRFTSSTSVTPTTDFNLSLDIVGFGGSGTGGPARTCQR